MAEEKNEKKKGGAEKGRTKHRSPNYPLFDLEKAVSLAKVLHDADKTHAVPVGVVHERWGYKKLSGAGNQAVGAAKSYGLITVEGKGDKRLVAVSDLGRKVVLGHKESGELLKQAALGPSLFNSLWDKYQETGIPSDEVLRHHLIFDRNFNEDVVDNAIARFKGTVAFAKLMAGDKIERPEGAGDDDSGNGDDEDSGDEHNRHAPKDKTMRRRQMQPGLKEDVFSLDEGAVVLQWPDRLSKTSAADLKDWLALIGRKIARASEMPPAEREDQEDDSDDE